MYPALTHERTHSVQVDGVTQATCGAFGSAVAAITSAAHVADLARLQVRASANAVFFLKKRFAMLCSQGIDLLSSNATHLAAVRRLVAAVDLHARILLKELHTTLSVTSLADLASDDAADLAAVSSSLPSSLCGGKWPNVTFFPSLDHVVSLLQLHLQQHNLAWEAPLAAAQRYASISAVLSRTDGWPRATRRPAAALEELLFSPLIGLTGAEDAAQVSSVKLPLRTSRAPLRFRDLFKVSDSHRNAVKAMLGNLSLQAISRVGKGSLAPWAAWPVRLSVRGVKARVNAAAIIDASVARSIITAPLLARISSSMAHHSSATLHVHTRLVVRLPIDDRVVKLHVVPFPVDFVVVNATDCPGRFDECLLLGGDVLMRELSPEAGGGDPIPGPAAFLLRQQLLSPETVWAPPAYENIARLPLLPASFAPRPSLSGGSSPPFSFVHPGIVYDKEQLDFIRLRVDARQGPIYEAYLKAIGSDMAALTIPHGPPPDGIVDCGPYSLPDWGCNTEGIDGEAALVQALLWVATGNYTFAERSLAIVNEYARRLIVYRGLNAKLHAGTSGVILWGCCDHSPLGILLIAWSVSKWVRTAEILRGTGVAWDPSDVALFTAMLKGVALPFLFDGASRYTGG